MEGKMIKNVEAASWGTYILVCFPYAGGGASTYFNWRKKFGKDIAVCPVQLPGREERFSEKPYNNMKDAVNDIVQAINPLITKNCKIAFFGHSMGAKIAYEVARELQKSGKGIDYLFVSGSTAPNIPSKKKVNHLDDDAFIAELQKYNGTPQQVAEQKELMKIFLPMLRADFALVETYCSDEVGVLDCPVVGFCGDVDEIVDECEMRPWNDFTDKGFELHRFTGNHFFIRDHEDEILEIIENRLLK